MKTAVVTGVNGFVAPHLIRELIKQNYSVIGVGIASECSPKIKKLLSQYYSVNLIDEWPDINNVEVIIHLAGLSAVGPSYSKPQLYINGNSSMVTNMCEYYLKQDNKPRILLVSSGAIYDNNQPLPISENSRLGYTSPYAISKILIETQAKYYRGRGLDIIIARPFNHIGPGQGPGFLLPDLYSRIKSLGKEENKIIVGNLKTKRDYTDVRDVVRAYVMLASKKKLISSTFNICSGNSVSGMEILEEINNNLKRRTIEVVIDESLIRPTDVYEIKGDSQLIYNETGWKPNYDITTTIKDYIRLADSDV